MNKIVEFPKMGLSFEFSNIISIGSFSITIYGILIALGLIVAIIYAFKNAKRFGVNDNKMIDCIIGGIVGAILGARIYFVAFSWSDYGLDFSSWDAFLETFLRIFKTWEGGMAIYGGLIGAVLVGLLIAKFRKLKFGPLLDITGLGFLIGQCIGRWGNFVNVEAFGSNTTLPWGMSSPTVTSYLTGQQEYLATLGINVNPTGMVHPTFLYESLWCLLGFVLLHFYSKKRKFDGEIFLMYLAFYGLGRVFIEGLRTDSLMWGYLRVSQVLAAVLVVTAVIMIIAIRSKIKNNNDPEYRKLYVNTDEWQDELLKKDAKATDYDDVESLDDNTEEIFNDEVSEDINEDLDIDDSKKDDDDENNIKVDL